ncbi:hypothetical protein BJV78DRAFT_1155852 [Lactifluus subvellereus]|nr:hypothetical protein BJV78DRAFT_1155852 [Lactifluus subvellereus]
MDIASPLQPPPSRRMRHPSIDGGRPALRLDDWPVNQETPFTSWHHYTPEAHGEASQPGDYAEFKHATCSRLLLCPGEVSIAQGCSKLVVVIHAPGRCLAVASIQCADVPTAAQSSVRVTRVFFGMRGDTMGSANDDNKAPGASSPMRTISASTWRGAAMTGRADDETRGSGADTEITLSPDHPRASCACLCKVIVVDLTTDLEPRPVRQMETRTIMDSRGGDLMFGRFDSGGGGYVVSSFHTFSTATAYLIPAVGPKRQPYKRPPTRREFSYEMPRLYLISLGHALTRTSSSPPPSPSDFLAPGLDDVKRHVLSHHLPYWIFCCNPSCNWRGGRDDDFKRHLEDCGPNSVRGDIYDTKLVLDYIFEDGTAVEVAERFALRFIAERAFELGRVEWRDLCGRGVNTGLVDVTSQEQGSFDDRQEGSLRCPSEESQITSPRALNYFDYEAVNLLCWMRRGEAVTRKLWTGIRSAGNETTITAAAGGETAPPPDHRVLQDHARLGGCHLLGELTGRPSNSTQMTRASDSVGIPSAIFKGFDQRRLRGGVWKTKAMKPRGNTSAISLSPTNEFPDRIRKDMRWERHLARQQPGTLDGLGSTTAFGEMRILRQERISLRLHFLWSYYRKATIRREARRLLRQAATGAEQLLSRVQPM